MENQEINKFRFGNKTITLCQARIISLNLHGLSRKEIANLLGNSVNTISTHYTMIYKVLDIHDSRKLGTWALTNTFDTNGHLNGKYLFDNYCNLPWEMEGE